jgi:hypothetical protein
VSATEEPLERLLRRVGEMVEGYEAGGSIAAQMQVIRDEWRRFKDLPPRGLGEPKTTKQEPDIRAMLVQNVQSEWAFLMGTNHTTQSYFAASLGYENAVRALAIYDKQYPRE